MKIHQVWRGPKRLFWKALHFSVSLDLRGFALGIRLIWVGYDLGISWRKLK